jgi:hypothetical protein
MCCLKLIKNVDCRVILNQRYLALTLFNSHFSYFAKKLVEYGPRHTALPDIPVLTMMQF